MGGRFLAGVLAGLALTQCTRAEPECTRPAFVWDLELVDVEAVRGTATLAGASATLGTRAVLRGAARDPRSGRVSNVQLLGSTDGTGLTVTLEKKEP